MPEEERKRAISARQGAGSKWQGTGGGILAPVKKHIYIYSPSSAVRDKAGFKRGIKRLESQGHEVEIDADALARHQRFAGDDDTRLAAIHRAAASGADIALISRGGYGLTRILPGINYKAVAKAIAGGTRFVGLSDFTAFQMAVMAKTGAVTWAGPALGEDFGAKEPDDIMEACFDDLITGQGEGTGWQLRKSAIDSIADSQGKSRAGAGFTVKDAVLWGGNLAMLSSLVGTPYLPAVKGGIVYRRRQRASLPGGAHADAVAVRRGAGAAKGDCFWPVHQLQPGAARQGLQIGLRDRLAAGQGQGPRVDRLAFWPRTDQGAAARGPENHLGGGGPGRFSALGSSAW
jgi:hypothetical protein